MRMVLAWAMLCLPITAFAYDFDAVCALEEDHKKLISPEEWSDLRSGKGEGATEDWLGSYRVYEKNGLSISYTGTTDIMEWLVTFAANRLPETMQTKDQIMNMLKASPEEVNADSFVVGCDCSETTFSFKGDALASMSISYASCQ